MARSVSPYERYGEANPDSDAYLREHIFVRGQTLTGLAHLYYDDWRMWRLIADKNRVTDPRTLEPGTRLLIPPRPQQLGRFESV